MFKLMTTYSNTLPQSHNHDSNMVAITLLHLLEELAILKRVIQHHSSILLSLNLNTTTHQTLCNHISRLTQIVAAYVLENRLIYCPESTPIRNSVIYFLEIPFLLHL